MSNGVVQIHWSPVPEDCSMSTISYRINIVPIGGNANDEDTRNTIDVSETFDLIPGQEYVATLISIATDTVRLTVRQSEATNCTFTAAQVESELILCLCNK